MSVPVKSVQPDNIFILAVLFAGDWKSENTPVVFGLGDKFCNIRVAFSNTDFYVFVGPLVMAAVRNNCAGLKYAVVLRTLCKFIIEQFDRLCRELVCFHFSQVRHQRITLYKKVLL